MHLEYVQKCAHTGFDVRNIQNRLFSGQLLSSGF